MLFHRAPRHRHVLRAFVLGMLALCLLLRPALASMGEVHELGHVASAVASAHGHGAHAHASVEDHASDASGADDRDGERDDAMHALLHAAHCCGHSPATAPGAGVVLANAPAADGVPAMTAPTVPAPPAASLLRPPIAA